MLRVDSRVLLLMRSEAARFASPSGCIAAFSRAGQRSRCSSHILQAERSEEFSSPGVSNTSTQAMFRSTTHFRSAESKPLSPGGRGRSREASGARGIVHGRPVGGQGNLARAVNFEAARSSADVTRTFLVSDRGKAVQKTRAFGGRPEATNRR